jgi:hypothetical protein
MLQLKELRQHLTETILLPIEVRPLLTEAIHLQAEIPLHQLEIVQTLLVQTTDLALGTTIIQSTDPIPSTIIRRINPILGTIPIRRTDPIVATITRRTDLMLGTILILRTDPMLVTITKLETPILLVVITKISKITMSILMWIEAKTFV